MDIPIYDPKTTAILCIDFYNDFLSERGKLWPWVKEMAERNRLLDNLRAVVRAARDVGAGIYHVPHYRWEPGDYVNWKYPSPYQLAAGERQAFAKGSWGRTFHDDFRVQPGDIVATEHWASSGFPNTDLDHQLRRFGKEKSKMSRRPGLTVSLQSETYRYTELVQAASKLLNSVPLPNVRSEAGQALAAPAKRASANMIERAELSPPVQYGAAQASQRSLNLPERKRTGRRWSAAGLPRQ